MDNRTVNFGIEEYRLLLKMVIPQLKEVKLVEDEYGYLNITMELRNPPVKKFHSGAPGEGIEEVVEEESISILEAKDNLSKLFGDQNAEYIRKRVRSHRQAADHAVGEPRTETGMSIEELVPTMKTV